MQIVHCLEEELQIIFDLGASSWFRVDLTAQFARQDGQVIENIQELIDMEGGILAMPVGSVPDLHCYDTHTRPRMTKPATYRTPCA